MNSSKGLNQESISLILKGFKCSYYPCATCIFLLSSGNSLKDDEQSQVSGLISGAAAVTGDLSDFTSNVIELTKQLGIPVEQVQLLLYGAL
ncbi:MAG: hypothetical protein AAF959_04420 [Cyanobacteria bacterium P01_D01_bin.56]